MKKENEKVVRIREIDGMPCINLSTAYMIEKKNLVFEWNRQFFKVRRAETGWWNVCLECRLNSICDNKIESICKAFDVSLGGCHMLELVSNYV